MRNGLDDGTITLSGISGCLWGLFGCWLLSDGSFDARAAGGLIVSPLIGILVGVSTRSLGDAPWWRRCTLALQTLYLAAIGFAIASGIGLALIGTPMLRTPFEPSVLRIVQQAVMMVVIGLSIGWVLLLWPLAIANHHIVWYMTSGPRDTGPLALNLHT